MLNAGTPLLLILAGLALVDSLSYGTLAIPVWLLMTPGRVRPIRMLAYLGTIGAFYLVVGLLLLLGAVSIADVVRSVLESDVGITILLAVGIGLIVLSFALDSPAAKARRAQGGGGRILRWRRIAMGDDVAEEMAAAARAGVTGTGPRLESGGPHAHPEPRMNGAAAPAPAPAPAPALGRGAGSTGALMGLALTAGLVEVASMLPYIAAITLLSQSGMGWPTSGLVLVGYCLVMIAPAMLLLVARIGAGRALAPGLQRIDAWMTKHAGSALSWIVGIVGVVLVINTAPTLFGG